MVIIVDKTEDKEIVSKLLQEGQIVGGRIKKIILIGGKIPLPLKLGHHMKQCH